MSTTEQIQELVAAVQGLTLEVQNLKTENTVLRQMVTAREPTPTDLPPMALSSGKYDGSPKKLEEFIEACTIHFAFRPHAYASEQARVGYMISHMTGNALAWATPLVTAKDPVLHDYDGFLNLFKQTFERPEISYGACEELLDIHQGAMDLLTSLRSKGWRLKPGGRNRLSM
ncbi:protein LDOC1-like [Ambystoma mexicanum]|uniref:protein LDOC1-like n=1 Tax=Ambystoma mexicanum TaxID=8296 RepID=UPI0037E8506A